MSDFPGYCRPIIGILGGMGPLATCDLFRKIIDVEEASSDQDHVRVLIDNNTTIPDRTAAILGQGPDPVPQMKASARMLEEMGAGLLIMPCNTAHHYYPSLVSSVSIPFLNMPEETALAAKKQGIKKACLLATDGTIEAGVYESAFSALGIDLILPDDAGQKAVMSLIYDGIKAGNRSCDPTPFLEAVDRLIDAIDPTLVLAISAVRHACGRIRPEYHI